MKCTDKVFFCGQVETDFLEHVRSHDSDLWGLSQRVNVLFVNGERFLDFPRPLPDGITFMGEVGQRASGKSKISPEIDRILENAKKGAVIFSLGTVSNTSSMPRQMAVSGFYR